MSELENIRNTRFMLHGKFLATASMLVLGSCVTADRAAFAEDGNNPAVWIELGGQMEMMEGTANPFTAPFMAVQPSPAPYRDDIFIANQASAQSSKGLQADVTVRPKGADWTVSIGVRYGRAQTRRHQHHQTQHPSVSPTKYGVPQLPARIYASTFADAKQKSDESHLVVDFSAGRDVGIGILGAKSRSTFGVGVRMVQFSESETVDLFGRPAVNVENELPTFVPASFPGMIFDQYSLHGEQKKSFRGLGPELSWSSSSDLLDNGHSSELTLDWGINAGLLFGRQRASTNHRTEARQFNQKYYNTYPTIYPTRNNHSTRSRSIVVPNVGGFAGLSAKYTNAKLSLGYRADFFFGAVDTGIDERHATALGFHGPFATISIGLGG